MKRLKHIFVVVALLAAMLPCSHAAEHHDHGHDAAATELCAFAAEPCECHSCNHQPCPDRTEIQFNHTPDSTTIQPPSAPALLFVLPEANPAPRQTLPPVPGILADLQTVQLLI